MADGEFDIYQTAGGITAVTNPVQRAILTALQDGDKQLPELVEITGKAKPTLSGVHMKELLNRELVTEHPHPTDSRRKVFRLHARPLGSSDVPVGELRGAVQDYARRTLGHPGLSLGMVLRILAAAPPGAAEKTLRAQARALGAAAAARLQADEARGFADALSRFVEEEGLARHLQIDFEALSFRCMPGEAVAGTEPGRVGLLLAGLAEGAAAANGLEGVSFSARKDGEAFRLQPAHRS